MPALFPVFLKLEGRKCLVVGGGDIAEQKLGGLVEAGAAITVVAPEVSETIVRVVREGEIDWREREFNASDLDGVVLVVAATGKAEVNERIFREADHRGILCNAVDEPERCHFYYPAVVRRGDLQIAISTNGKSPALAQRIRRELEVIFDSAYGEWLQWLGRVRELYFRAQVNREERVRSLHRIASRTVYERYRAAQKREVRHG